MNTQIDKDLPRPSAKPRIILHITKAVTLPANIGVIKVAILHKRTLHISTFFAPNFVAENPPIRNIHVLMLLLLF